MDFTTFSSPMKASKRGMPVTPRTPSHPSSSVSASKRVRAGSPPPSSPRASAARSPSLSRRGLFKLSPSSPSALAEEAGLISPGKYGDRFIPNRDALVADVATQSLFEFAARPLPSAASDDIASEEFASAAAASPVAAAAASASGNFTTPRQHLENEYNNVLADSLFPPSASAAGGTRSAIKSGGMLSFRERVAPVESARSPLDVSLRELFEHHLHQDAEKALRHIPSTAERILDAPELMDDYYLNLLDWSNSNVLAVGLNTCLYLWNAVSGSIDLLLEETEENHITSVRWNKSGTDVAVGFADSTVQLWDAIGKKKTRVLKNHSARVGSLSWNDKLLSSGGRDAKIFNTDTRMPQGYVSTFLGHEEEICGLQWSPDGTQLASGGNDNLCCIWDRSSSEQPRFTLKQHTAAVKALAWCPWQRQLLATGGGTADRHIRFFNTATGQCLQAVDTKSQVCSIQWSKTHRELISSHGYSQNQLTVWQYPRMNPIANLTGHTSRVLHTALSPDGTTVCSAAADETLRFWSVWDSVDSQRRSKQSAVESPLAATIH